MESVDMLIVQEVIGRAGDNIIILLFYMLSVINYLEIISWKYWYVR